MDKLKVVSIAVASGLIIAGIVGFIVYIEVVGKDVTMLVSDRDVTVGELVNFTAEGGSDDLAFRWEFGDGTNASGRSVQHFYASVGSFNATLYLDDGGDLSRVDTARMTVSDLVFRMPFPRDGDSVTYSVVGTMNISNPQGILNTQVGDHNISLVLAKLSLDGPLDATWTVQEAYDAYGATHDALAVRHDLDSVVTGKTFVKSEVGTTISDIAGDLWLNTTERLDLDTNGTLSMTVETVFDSSQGILGSSGLVDENATLFRDQRIISLLAVAQAGVYGRGYSMSMSSYSVPGVITWELVGPEAVDGLAAYRLRGSTPLVENATVDVWVSPSIHKLPRISISVHTVGNTTIDVEVVASLVSERRGESPIPFGECREDIVYHLLPSRDGLETAAQVQKRLLPADGTGETWYGLFTPRKAIDFAKANEPLVGDFMLDNDDTFAESASYSVLPNGTRQWSISLLTSQNATSLSFTVANDTGVLWVLDAAVANVTEATQRPAAQTVITYAQAERLLTADPSVAPLFNGTVPSDWVMTYVRAIDFGLGDLSALTSLLAGLPSGEVFVFSQVDSGAYVVMDADNGAIVLADISGTEVTILG